MGRSQSNFYKTNSETKISGKIALSFFPLENSDFSYSVFRKPCTPKDTKDTFPNCSRRKLPIFRDGQEQEYRDYWVDYKKRESFEEFLCHSNDNIFLTLDIVYKSLVGVCRQNLIPEKEFLIRPDFNSRRIYFCLEVFPEGKRTVWLEPYFLKASRTFGFLADFKFISKLEKKGSRRLLELSLSLDKDGRSNRNYYLEKYEKLRDFTNKYLDKLFPIPLGNEHLYMRNSLLEVVAGKLNPKQYIFAGGKNSKSQFNGILANGPLEEVTNNPKIYFLYLLKDKPFADDLFRALRGDTFNTTFPGMKEIFKFRFDKETVGGSEILDYDIESLEETIERITKDANGRQVIPILLIPNKRNSGKDSDRLYYLAKYIFLKKKLPSQFVSLVQLRITDQLKWSVSNIGLGLFAKMGGKPWKVNPSTENSLIIGLGQAHKIIDDKIEKFYAYSVLTESTGLYKELKILGQGSDKNSYLSRFKNNLIELLEQYYSSYKAFVIHSTFSIPYDELEVLEDVLNSFSQKKDGKKFVVMKFNDGNRYFGYSLTSNSRIPYESSYIQLSKDEFLVWFEGLQYHTPNVYKKIERPLHIKFLYPHEGLSEDEKIGYLQDSINISGANWRGFNAKSLPVSVYYAHLVAEYYKEFQTYGLDDIDIEAITPWFL